jgi:hypothetical protein
MTPRLNLKYVAGVLMACVGVSIACVGQARLHPAAKTEFLIAAIIFWIIAAIAVSTVALIGLIRRNRKK